MDTQVKLAVKRVLDHFGPEGKRLKFAEAVISYILDAPEVERQARLESVLVRLEREYGINKQTKEASVWLIHQLCGAILARRLIHIPFENEDHMERGRISQEELLLFVGRYNEKQLRYAARNWFAVEWRRFVGECVERSTQYALVLLEEVHYFLQRAAQCRLDPPKFEALLRDDPRILRGLKARNSMHSAASEPVHTDLPSKRWLEQLINGALESEHVAEVLQSVMNTLSLFQPDNQTMGIRMPEDRSKAERFITTYLLGAEKFDPTKAVILLSKEYEEKYLQWREAVDTRAHRELARSECCYQWLAEHREQVGAAMEKKLNEIQHQGRRLLRADGEDHVEIRLHALRQVGVRSVVFRPEGQAFPNVGIQVYIRKETPHLLGFSAQMDLTSDLVTFRKQMEGVLYSEWHDEGEATTLLSVVIIDILHRIVLGQRDLKEIRGKDPSQEVDGAHKRVNIRAHRRPLPKGYKASDEAKVRASEYAGWILGDGWTFVRASYCQRRLQYELVTEPFAVYSDEDFMDFKLESER